MCLSCVIASRPDRGKSCLQDGSYLLNFKACAACGKRDIIKNIKRSAAEEEEDGDSEELIKYEHICSSCNHVICEHFYSFKVLGSETQEFLMDCMLCGHAADSVSLRGPQSMSNADANLPPNDILAKLPSAPTAALNDSSLQQLQRRYSGAGGASGAADDDAEWR